MYLYILFLFQDRDIDLATSDFRMKMETERWVNGGRFVNGECKRTLNKEHKLAIKARRAHGEQMQKRGK